MSGTDILRLPNLRTAEVDEQDDHYRICADGQDVLTQCPAYRGGILSGHGSNRVKLPR